MAVSPRTMLAEAWRSLGGDPAQLSAVTFPGPDGTLPAVLPVTALAQATVGAASLAAAGLRVPTSGRLPASSVQSERVAVAFVSERHLRLDGAPLLGMDPLSAFLPAADRWVRLHGNYPHHRARLYRALGVDPDSPDSPAAAIRTIRELPADDVERRVTEAGGLAVPVRTPDEWRRHPQGVAVGRLPLLTLRRVTDTAPTPLGGRTSLPANGIRVLDLTRVIAGPVGTRALALFGADVLRVDSPGLAEIPGQHLDTGPGKRSTLLDLARPADRSTFEELLATADVVVTGYRPGALDRHGLSPEALLERRPDLVVATLSAWGSTGPDAHRRGFDSLVQAATGIAVIEGAHMRRPFIPFGEDNHDAPHPHALPAQALDHGTGYLLAAAVLRGLRERADTGGGWHAELSLAQTAAWLLRHHQPTATPTGSGVQDPAPWLREADTSDGRIRYAAPPFDVNGVPADWTRPAVPWGTSESRWT